MRTTGDGGGWNQQFAGCSLKDTVAHWCQTMQTSVNEHSQLEIDVDVVVITHT